MRYKRLNDSELYICCSRFYDNLKELYASRAVHYCSIQTLDAILRDGFLRAVDSRFMNDLGEYSFGIDIFKNREENLVDFESFVPMTVSFSTEEDLIPQWEIYAKEIGIGIEMDFDFAQYWLPDKENADQAYVSLKKPMIAQQYKKGDGGETYIDTGIPYPINLVYATSPSRVGRLKTFQKLQNAIYVVSQDEDVNFMEPKKEHLLRLAATFIKESGFSYEKEARISTFLLKGEEEMLKLKPNIQFHANGSYLRPYVNLCFIYGDVNPQNTGWPIRAICVGPGRNQEKAVESVVKRLEFGEVKTLPLPYEVFADRLKEYMITLIDKTCPSKKTVIKAEINSYIDSCITESDKYEFTESQKLHKCINADEYEKAKEVIAGVNEKIKNIYGEYHKKAVKVLQEYNERNYFSWYGITVKASDKTLSFV